MGLPNFPYSSRAATREHLWTEKHWRGTDWKVGLLQISFYELCHLLNILARNGYFVEAKFTQIQMMYEMNVFKS